MCMKQHRVECTNCSYEWTTFCGGSCPACMSEQYDVVGEERVVNTNFNNSEPLQWANQKRREIEEIVESGYEFDREEKGYIYFSK